MATTTLRNNDGSVLCYLEENAEVIKIATKTGATKGRYDKRSDRTYRIDGTFIGHGNLLMTLL